jgi:predicted nuclease of predicted toxin-antitoxin system
MKILIDHNIEGHAILLWDALAKTGLTELLPLKIVMFSDAGLTYKSRDREVWRFAQANRMILLTDNRNDNEKDSLERTIREENIQNSLPVLTIGKSDRIKERIYRERCAERIGEIVTELENYLGVGRIFIP